MKKGILIIGLIFWSITTLSQEKTLTLSLDEAVSYALKNNYDNKAAKNDIEAAKERKWETTTIGLPQFDGKVDYLNNLKRQFPGVDFDQDGVVDFNAKHSVNAGVTLKQLLFDGSYLVGLQSARTYLKISEQAKEKTELLTREAVINAYGNILITEKNIEILENNIKVLAKNYNDAKKIFENGLNEEEDVEQLEITLGNLKSQHNAAKRMKDIAYKMLNISIGSPIETKLILTDSLDSLTESNINLGLITQAFNLENHIDFKIAENDRESKRLLMKLEQSKALPSLNAFLNYNYIANSETFTFFNNSQTWIGTSTLGLSLNIPIFSSFGRRSKTQQAKIALATADIRLTEIKQKLNLQVKQAKSNYQLSVENYQTAKKNLNLAERIEKKQRVKFFEGISTSFDLTQAQNQLYTQQQNYISSMLEVIANKAKLENALNIPIKK